MFLKEYDSSNRAFALHVTITCKGKKKFRAYASDYGRANSKYADRVIEVDGKRSIFFSFPVSPKKLGIVIYDESDNNSKDFDVQIMEAPLTTYNVWLDDNTREFLELAIPFCQMSGFTQASPNGSLFATQNEKFKIVYFPVIRDFMSGKVHNTPARIGHQSGKIEVAKAKFDGYTIPMRLIILLHEFSHKYKNPKIGLKIEDEFGADINALYIYLGLGFSKIDAICVFANVFLKAQSDGNIARMRKIMNYIQRFENGEYAQKNLN
jgi:hypothetical protein